MNRAFSSVKRLLACAFAIVLALCVCACKSGSKPEDVVKTTVDNTFAVFQHPTDEDISQYIDDKTKEQISAYGIDMKDFFEHVFKNLSYTINNVTVDGDQATVDLTVKNVNLDEAMNAALSDFDTWSNTDEAMKIYTDSGEQGLYQKLFEYLYEEIDNLAAGDGIKTIETQLFLETQEDGSWDVTSEGNDAFYSSLYGGASF